MEPNNFTWGEDLILLMMKIYFKTYVSQNALLCFIIIWILKWGLFGGRLVPDKKNILSGGRHILFMTTSS